MNTASHGTQFEIVLGSHALRAQPTDYSGTPLIRSVMGQKKLAVLMGGYITSPGSNFMT